MLESPEWLVSPTPIFGCFIPQSFGTASSHNTGPCLGCRLLTRWVAWDYRSGIRELQELSGKQNQGDFQISPRQQSKIRPGRPRPIVFRTGASPSRCLGRRASSSPGCLGRPMTAASRPVGARENAKSLGEASFQGSFCQKAAKKPGEWLAFERNGWNEWNRNPLETGPGRFQEFTNLWLILRKWGGPTSLGARIAFGGTP